MPRTVLRGVNAVGKMLTKPAQPAPAPARVRVGTVTAIGTDGTVTLKLAGDTGAGNLQTLNADGTVTTAALGGSGTAVAGVSRYEHYVPAVGDVVDVLQVGGTLRVLGQLATADDQAWQPLTLVSPWAFCSNANFPHPECWKGPDGVVHLRGAVQGPATAITASTNLAQLPSGYYPGAGNEVSFSVSSSLGSGVTRVHVLTSGMLNVQTPYPAASAIFFLDGIHFRAK